MHCETLQHVWCHQTVGKMLTEALLWLSDLPPTVVIRQEDTSREGGRKGEEEEEEEENNNSSSSSRGYWHQQQQLAMQSLLQYACSTCTSC